VWEFLDASGEPMTGKSQRATNLGAFFGYLPFFWLGALRDAGTEFTPRSSHWGRLLRSVRVPDDLELEVLRTLTELDSRVVASDKRLAEIADLIGNATRVAIGEGPGAARLSTLPLTIEDMLQRTGIVLRNEAERPWLPLGHHGQGLQSLAVIFLFQAAVLQQMAEAGRSGMSAVFAIEEPEAHLHPQAARTLWERVNELPGQRLLSTHSPYFVQHVPLRDLRILRLKGGCTEVAAIPDNLVSDIPWDAQLDALTAGDLSGIIEKDPRKKTVAARRWLGTRERDLLVRCYRGYPDAQQKTEAIDRFRHACRILPSKEDESKLGFLGRRVRGEIFFARRWILVEGVTEYMMLHALGRALGWSLDAHGVVVIDFRFGGDAGIYAALADGFGFPWHMVVDGDAAGSQYKRELLKRGFRDEDLMDHVYTLDPHVTLEDQLITDGHERSALQRYKTICMHLLSSRVSEDASLAAQMPAVYLELICHLRDLSA
jgi:putative ATP-dependent endonuclease of OLD family